nr:uncharacterized mitochondrial protein AtMg00810-like [Tanacetum cinerariifolium]
AKPTEKNLQAVKWIFRYLKGTINMDLWYSKAPNMSLTAYADADHAGCKDTKCSTSGSAQFLDCRAKSVGSTAPLDKYCEIKKLDSKSYHTRGACLRP